MSGLELQREIAGGDAPAIVFVTGHGDVPSSLRAMKAAAIEFLLKPFDDQELLRAIDAAIAQDCDTPAFGRREVRAPALVHVLRLGAEICWPPSRVRQTVRICAESDPKAL